MPVRISSAKGIQKDSSAVGIRQKLVNDNNDVANKGRTDRNGNADFVLDVPQAIDTLEIEANSNIVKVLPVEGLFQDVKSNLPS